MNKLLADLIRLIELERLEINLFRGESRDIGSPQVFGGQVLGQALYAAYATVEGRTVHSMHAYFLRRGDFNAPIVYEVDRSRDGDSFTSRRVVAIQHGQQIFHMSASFQVDQSGPEHQVQAPDVAPPEDLADVRVEVLQHLDRMSPERRRYWSRERPFETRSVEPLETVEARPGVRHLWLRVIDRCSDDPVMHHCLLAYMSDFHLLETSTLPHGPSFRYGNVKLASIDHAMWFHRPFRIDEWVLYALVSPTTSGSRGLAFGRIFDRQGRLVASSAQEGLMRRRT